MMILPIKSILKEVRNSKDRVAAICGWWNANSNFKTDHFEVYRVTEQGLVNCNPDDDWRCDEEQIRASRSSARMAGGYVVDFRATRFKNGVWVAFRDGRSDIHSVSAGPGTFKYWSELSLEGAIQHMTSRRLLQETIQTRIGQHEFTPL